MDIQYTNRCVCEAFHTSGSKLIAFKQHVIDQHVIVNGGNSYVCRISKDCMLIADLEAAVFANQVMIRNASIGVRKPSALVSA